MGEENKSHQKSKSFSYVENLEYGDIIEIISPTNVDFHEKTFFITYIDNSKIKITSVSNIQPFILNIDEDGQLTDESIKQIHLLNRSDEKGYARQKNLLPKTWIDVHFEGEFPTIITGEITNLEDDQIEIIMYPSLDVFYVDFEYKGLPEDIPISKIVIRKKPVALQKIITLTAIKEDMEEGEVYEEEQASMEQTPTGEYLISIPESAEPDENIRDELHRLYVNANNIVFGVEETIVGQVVEVSEKNKIYSVETQVNDLMDELLSTIPNVKRTKKVMENIHRLIERFKELRTQFSKMDEFGNVRDFIRIGMNHKPLIQHIKNMDKSLKWLIPTVSSRRKIYQPGTDVEVFNDIVGMSNDQDLVSLKNIQDDYFENKEQGDVVKYKNMVERSNPIMTPFEKPIFDDDCLNNAEVMTSFDAIINNLDDFYSSVVKGNMNDSYTSVINKAELAKQRFVIQRYNLGVSMLEQKITKTGKKIYKRDNITNNDSMCVKSFIMLPQSVVKFSSIELPGTNILNRSVLSQNYFLLFRILKQSTNIEQYIVNSFDKEIDYEKLEEEMKTSFLSNMKEFVLHESLFKNKEKFQKFLNIIIPNTRSLLRILQKYMNDKLSFVEVIRAIEPFLVYSNDITFGHYKDIRYFIKERMIEFNKQFTTKSKDFAILRNAVFNIHFKINQIDRILNEKPELVTLFEDAYGLNKLDKTNFKSTSELLSLLYSKDNCNLFSNMIRFLLISLVIPEPFLELLNKPPVSEDMYYNEKIKAVDCSRRFLAKRYSSLTELQKDNGEEIFFDKEFDDTPYPILDKYSENKKKMLQEDFIDFLAENLVQFHSCPRDKSDEMARLLIAGKRIIKDGEYAILQTLPKSSKTDEQSDDPEKEQKYEDIAELKLEYYRRVKNNWVRDNNVSDNTFIDNNTLFCNISNECNKNMKTMTCDTNTETKNRIKYDFKNKLINEFDTRLSKSIEDKEKELDECITNGMKKILKLQTLQYIQLYRANNLAFELGNTINKETIQKSPYTELIDLILSQDDFVKKQYDIVTFVDRHCRIAMVNELQENKYWYYCKDTNLKLLPTFFHELAETFVSGKDYQLKQLELCNSQGELSDDGDSCVDKHSGMVIRKLDFSSEEGFDLAGYKISTSDIIQKDTAVVMEEALKKNDIVYEGEIPQIIYNILSTIGRNIGVSVDGVREFVLRVSIEIINKAVMSDSKYKAFSENMEKKKGKTPPLFIKYRNQSIITIVSTTLLLAIQTSTPPFKPKITAPGCVRSFSGYPIDGDSDNSGIKYIACVIHKSKSSTEPWDSIQKIPIDDFIKGMKKICQEYLMTRIDIIELIKNKRDYLVLHPEINIPDEHQIVKWTQFTPPVVPFTVIKSLHNISNEVRDELLELMRKGNSRQRELLSVFKSKIILYGYGIVESIKSVVINKDLILKTSANIPFLQNSCCNEKYTQDALHYFIEEDPNIANYIDISDKLSIFVSNTKELTSAPIFFHDINTSIIRPPLSKEHFEENIYNLFIHYCKFDRDAPIPNHLKKVCVSKPSAGYESKKSLKEKIQYLKSTGKIYDQSHLEQLTQIINQINKVNVIHPQEFSQITILIDLIQHLDFRSCDVIEEPLRKLLTNVLAKYNPGVMVMEDNEEIERLKNYLAKCNQKMFDEISNFLKKYGNLRPKEFEKLETFISSIHLWNIDRDQKDTKLYYEEGLYTITQFMKTSVVNMSKVLPEIILNNKDLNEVYVPKHWYLSKQHEAIISRFVKEYYEEINKFKQDTTLFKLLQELQTRLIDINLFMQHLPVLTPIHKNDNAFYLLFDKKTIFLLMSYCFYSTLYEFVQLSDDTNFLKEDIQEKKQNKRQYIRNLTDNIEQLQTVYEIDNEDDAEVDRDISEIHIELGNIEDLKQRTASLMITFLNIDQENKKLIDFTYQEIKNRMSRSKHKEKDMITDFFKNMDNDERKVKYLEKTYKMGRWNIQQKGLVTYDKNTFDKEIKEQGTLFREELIDELAGNIDEDVEEMDRDIDEIQEDEERQIEEEHDQEGNDISNFADDYMDGNYYGDDDPDDFEKD